MAGIDVLYPIHKNEKNEKFFLKNLNYSIRSLQNNDFDFSICILDTSPSPIKKDLDFIGDFRYFHYSNSFFSRAHAINVGVKQLVDAPIFRVSDADIIFEGTHISDVYDEVQKESIRITIPSCHNLDEETDEIFDKNGNTNFELLKQMPVWDKEGISVRKTRGIWNNPGQITIETEFFYELRGMDEEFVQPGYCDANFLDRVNKSVKSNEECPLSRNVGTVIHLKHEKVYSPDINIAMFKNKLKSDEIVNPNGWGLV